MRSGTLRLGLDPALDMVWQGSTATYPLPLSRHTYASVTHTLVCVCNQLALGSNVSRPASCYYRMAYIPLVTLGNKHAQGIT